MTADLTPNAVIDFLKDRPDFLAENAEALAGLGVETKQTTRGNRVVDFQKILVQKLKDDKSKVEDQSRDVIETARSNMQVQARTHAAIVRLLEADSFEAFIDLITSELGILLDVDLVSLLLEHPRNGAMPPKIEGIRFVDEGMVGHYLKNQPIRLEGDCMGQERIFGGGAGLVRSQAFARLDISSQAPVGMLALGSRDPQLFQDGQSSDYLSFLALVVAGLTRLWLGIPRL